MKKNQLLSKVISCFLSASIIASPMLVYANALSYTEAKEFDIAKANVSKKYNFSDKSISGYTSVKLDDNGNIPIYLEKTGYGFVSESCSMPSRKVNLEQIRQTKEGFVVIEKDTERFNIVDKNGNQLEFDKSTTHNFGGMVFRIKAPAGGYKVSVETTSGKENSIVSISGMQSTRIESTGFWDAARLVPIKNYASWNGDTWSYTYANGMDFIDIEVEPKKAHTPVGIKSIKLTPIAISYPEKSDKTTVYTLGDSTVKSYTFNEAPMSSWGQVIDDLFDKEKANVINYSMGGRSLKNMYIEGRFNDLVMNAKAGDYVFIQSGHNDERKGTDIGTADGETARFGRGATEEMYKSFLENIFIPACRARGVIPIIVSPMSRIDVKVEDGQEYVDSFKDRKFPKVAMEAAKETNVTFIDLNKRSLEYYNEIGATATKNIFMSLEAGETPGKTNSGSYANGHPDNKIDGTHYKEALSKQFARIILEELYKSSNDNIIANDIINLVCDTVKVALETNDWTKVYPEICNDTTTGEDSYYRNQIERLVKMGIMKKDNNGNFNPKNEMSTKEYINALCKLWNIQPQKILGYNNQKLTREVMASILYDAYVLKFGTTKDEVTNNVIYNKPAYMTDYNGKTIGPDDPNYDPNLIGENAQYYSLTGYNVLTDTNKVSNKYSNKVKQAYNLGLIRTESGIERGSMKTGTEFEPQDIITREKAAKSLYFMWVLSNPVLDENDKY